MIFVLTWSLLFSTVSYEAIEVVVLDEPRFLSYDVENILCSLPVRRRYPSCNFFCLQTISGLVTVVRCSVQK